MHSKCIYNPFETHVEYIWNIWNAFEPFEIKSKPLRNAVETLIIWNICIRCSFLKCTFFINKMQNVCFFFQLISIITETNKSLTHFDSGIHAPTKYQKSSSLWAHHKKKENPYSHYHKRTRQLIYNTLPMSITAADDRLNVNGFARRRHWCRKSRSSTTQRSRCLCCLLLDDRRVTSFNLEIQIMISWGPRPL